MEHPTLTPGKVTMFFRIRDTTQNVSFHSRSIWYTDKENDPRGRNRVTAYMKRLAVDGVSGTF
ncbi:MAG: hypothetical protein HQM08_07820 [Candidatus Riflebacteria bacterium]|nr:hypothetical protein [Candidatus Riflebacteria bacterium]